MFGNLALLRALALPIPVGLLLYVALSDPAWWRRGLLLTTAGLMASLALGELWLFRRRGYVPPAFARTIFLSGCGILAVIVATGGIESPFTVSLLPIAVLMGIFERAPGRRATFLALELLGLCGNAAFALLRLGPGFVPVPFGGGPRAGHNDALVIAQSVLLGLGVVFALAAGVRFRRGLDILFERSRTASATALAARTEQTQALTTLSAEIAHELKNPLASVKGLAALVAADQQGKNVERVAVLRREVERMQTIIEEFLNFSRPLGPLAREPANLVELCQSVLALHEGQLRDGGIGIELNAPTSVELRCDARKIKQVVINLVQNAIEASARGGSISVEVHGGNEAVGVRILDRGAGLAPSLAAHAFDAGATNKPKGSGLGLTIARALARQHGGELTLENRVDGGCVAKVELPRGEA